MTSVEAAVLSAAEAATAAAVAVRSDDGTSNVYVGYSTNRRAAKALAYDSSKILMNAR